MKKLKLFDLQTKFVGNYYENVSTFLCWHFCVLKVSPVQRPKENVLNI